MRQKKSIQQTAKEHVEKTVRKEDSRGDSERVKNQKKGRRRRRVSNGKRIQKRH